MCSKQNNFDICGYKQQSECYTKSTSVDFFFSVTGPRFKKKYYTRTWNFVVFISANRLDNANLDMMISRTVLSTFFAMRSITEIINMLCHLCVHITIDQHPNAKNDRLQVHCVNTGLYSFFKADITCLVANDRRNKNYVPMYFFMNICQ